MVCANPLRERAGSEEPALLEFRRSLLPPHYFKAIVTYWVRPSVRAMLSL